MPPLPLPTSSAPGRFAEAGGRLINAMAEKLPDGRIRRYRVPGLRQILEIADEAHFRGGIEINNQTVVAFDGKLYRIDDNGDGTYSGVDLGTLSGSGRVFFARNNAATPDIVAVTDSTAYVISLTTGASSYPDADVGSPNAVSFLKGYFVFSYGDGRMRSSGLNDTAINTLDTAVAESKPDGLLFPAAIGSDILAFGSQTFEIWRIDPNNVNGFPFSFLDTIPRGLIGQDAIAGWEDGWTTTIMFVGDDGVPYMLQGYKPVPLAHPPVVKAIERLEDRTTIQAMVYTFEGHPIWCISSDDWTWCYDLATGEWHERASEGSDRWRGSGSLKAFDRWLVGDNTTGKLFFVDPDYHREGDDPLTFRVVSATVSGFPARAALPGLQIDMLAGVGEADGEDPIETDPTCWVSVSHDGGVTWMPPVFRELGQQGRYQQPIRVNRLGLASTHGVQVSISVSDPVPVSLFAAELLRPEQRES